MMRALWIALAVQLSSVGICWSAPPSSPGGRVETMDELESYQEFSEVERLGLFLREPGEINLPNLRKAKFINIDSDNVTAVSLPALESVGYLIVRGRKIETLELPQLRNVGIDFRVQGTMIRELNLENLRRAGQLKLTSNPKLAEIETPFVYEFAEVTLANNAALGEETEQRLRSLQAPPQSKPSPTFMPITLRLQAPSMRATGKTHARFDTVHSTFPRRSSRNAYPRYVPFYPMFRPFIGGYWGYGFR